MERAIKIGRDTYWLGERDYKAALFEALWPIPNGMTFNSYLIIDEKNLLIDTVKECGAASFLERVSRSLPKGKELDYLVINHMEPDHSGALSLLCERFPKLKLIGNKKTVEFLDNFYQLGSRCSVVKDGESINLGEHQLSFHLTPMVHWPETMMTFDETSKILFSGDVFGAFGAQGGSLFDDEVKLKNYEADLLRYYSNIIAQYSSMVQKALQKTKNIPLQLIAPTHGILFKSNPQHIIDLYEKWSSQKCKEEIVVAYASMYGNTREMAQVAARAACVESSKPVIVHDLSSSHPSYVLSDTWIRKGLLLASCSYNSGIFPAMREVLAHLKEKKYKDRKLALISNYSWSGGAKEAFESFANSFGAELLEPILNFKSRADEKGLTDCESLGRNLAQQLTKC